jgi:AcrR family transcriptional regulator
MSQNRSRESRRLEIVRAAWELVAERGVDAVRIQDIAASVGTSTGTIHYYFHDRADILAAALEFSAKRFARRKAEQVPEEVTYLERIFALIDSQLVGEGTRQEWAVWIEFWGEATRQQRFADLNHDVYTQWRALIADQVRGGQQVGEFADDVVAEDFAADLIALMDGLGIQTTLGGPGMSPDYMRQRLRHYAERLLGVRI